MRLLVVTYRFPAYTHDAPCNTIYRLVRYLSRRHQVTLVALASSETVAQRRDLVGPYCHRIETVVLPPWRGCLNVGIGLLTSREPIQMPLWRSRMMAERVHQVVREERIELAYGYHLRSTQYLATVKGIPRCVALQPSQVLHFGRRRQHIRNPILRLGYAIEHARLVGYELGIAQQFERCLLISERDRQAIDPRGELTNVFYNPHGVDTDYFQPPAANSREPNTLVFSGVLSIDTNTDAVLHFCRSILPLVRQRVPDVKLYVVGKQPPRAVRALARRDPSITVTGYVEDLRLYLWRARVGIDPLRIGAGLQNKVLEGMAAGLPMVMTGVANEGIGAVPAEQAIVVDKPAEFAAAVVRLLGDAGLRERVARAGRDFVVRRWSWEAHFEPLEQLFYQLVSARTPAEVSD